MKAVVVTFLLLNTIQSMAQAKESDSKVTLKLARELYFAIGKDKCNGLKLAEMFESETSIPDPILTAYFGASAASAPACVVNPASKLSWFNKGKKLLNQSVESGLSIFEIRFLRFATQSKSPRFLNYRHDLENDKIFLLNNLANGAKQLNNDQVFKQMAEFLIDSEYIIANEKTLIKEFLNNNKL